MRFFSSKTILVANILLFFALTISFSPHVNAQIYAEIHGTVTDTTGAVIPNVAVQVINTSTGIVTTTNANPYGYYIFPQLQVGGPYSITITAAKFERFTSDGLNLRANDNRDVDAKLKVGVESQTITVTATALQVETSDTQLKQVVTAEQLEGVPLEGRDPAGLQKLMPGVVESSDRFGSYASNGSQTAQNNYMLNGTDINDGPLQDEGISINPDALQEENILSSTINPEFARNSGAIVNQILKNGTNAFHGSGFEFYRDTFMNNGDYFAQTRPDFHQNLYGGTLGGPVFKNKLFFFVAYQGDRNRIARTNLPETLNGTKGTNATGQFAGEFSNDQNYAQGFAANNTRFDNTVVNPNTGQVACPSLPQKVYSDSLSCNAMPFAYNGFSAGTPWVVAYDNGSGGNATINIANNTWNSLAAKLINQYVPQSNQTIGQQTYYNFNALTTGAENQGIIRLDYTPSAKDSIWVSTVLQSSPSVSELSYGGGSFPGFGMTSSQHYKILSASWTHTFSANKLNDLHGGYFRMNYPSVIPSTGIPSNFDGAFNIHPQLAQSGLPYIGVGSYFNLGFSFEGPQPRIDTNLNYADSFMWVIGNHSLQFGGSFEQFRVSNHFGYENNGAYTFNGGGRYSSGDPLIDFTLGIPDSFAQTNDGFIDTVATELYGYAQDNWKATSDLTINFGLGWDVEEPNQNRQFNGLGIVCWQNSNAKSGVYPGGPPGLFYNGDPGCNQAGGPTTHYDHLAPRFGFAWSPSTGSSKLIGRPGAHELSIRGGFGVYYNRDQEEQSLQNLSDPPIFYTSHGAADFGGSPAFANPYADVAGNGSESNPFPFNTPRPGQTPNWSIYNELQLAAFDKKYNVPYTYNFNLNIQRALRGNMVFQIGYVGSISHRLATWYEGDNITPAGHASCLANPACTGNPSYIHLYFPQYTAQSATTTGSQPWYLSVAEQNTVGHSNYNSLQASLIKAMSHGLQFTIAYTYSHALDDGSGYESTTGGSYGYGAHGRVRNYVPGYEYLNYGSSDNDARQRLVASYIYTVPVFGFMRSNVILREAFSGWGVGGITAMQSGNPISVSMGTDNSLWCDALSYFGCPDNPNTNSYHIKTYNPRAAGHKYFDTTPFSPEPLGGFGNTGRNFFHGPGFNYTNLQLSKNIHFSADQTRYMQLRVEAFNVFNHVNFQASSGNYSSNSFGVVTSVAYSADPNQDPQPARVLQLVGKVYF